MQYRRLLEQSELPETGHPRFRRKGPGRRQERTPVYRPYPDGDAAASTLSRRAVVHGAAPQLAKSRIPAGIAGTGLLRTGYRPHGSGRWDI